MSFNVENIEAYLTGKMSASDKFAMEEGMKNDPLLKGEVDLQNDIIESLKNNRRIQLKSRLNNLEVATTTTGVSSALKIAASFITIGMIGAGIYYVSILSDKDKISENKNAPFEVTEEIISGQTNNQTTTNNSVVIDKVNGNTKVGELVNKNKTTTNKKTTTTSNTASSNATNVVANVPNGEMENQESIFKTDNVTLPNGEIDKAKVSKAENIDTEKIDIKKYNYKFSSGKLYLSRSLEEVVYEVLEFKYYNVNGTETKKFYLSFEGKYFELKPTTSNKSVPLILVTDENMLAKLRATK